MPYHVRHGDSLWRIAERQLGNAQRWPEIARLNSLQSPYKILVGQTLRLPSQTQSVTGATSLYSGTRAAGASGLPLLHANNGIRTASASAAAALPPEQSPTFTMPGRAYFFLVAREVAENAKLVRKVVALPPSAIESLVINSPHLFGFSPRAPKAAVSLGEHALGNTLSPYMSASTKPGGAPNFPGESWFIDVAKAKKAGATIHSTEEIVRDLDRLEKANPSLSYRIAKLKRVIDSVEGEVLIEGRVPAAAVQTAEAAAREAALFKGLKGGAKVLSGVGIVLTVYDMGKATQESVKQKSIKPVAAESIRQVGGWGFAMAGAKLGAMAGAAVGIETGPGAVITGAVGGLVGGVLGYVGSDWVADHISPN